MSDDDRATTGALTADEARRRLDEARDARPDDARDRRVHGLATAGFGLVVGGFVAVQHWLGTVGPRYGLLVAGYLALLCALASWQTRSSRLVPRRSRSLGRWGLAGTVLVMLAAITTLNGLESTAPSAAADAARSPWVLALAGLLVAVPMLVAGAVIRRGPRR